MNRGIDDRAERLGRGDDAAAEISILFTQTANLLEGDFDFLPVLASNIF